MKKMFKYGWLCMAALLMIANSCKKHDDPTPPSGVTASFQYAIDETDFLKVTFSNFSTNAASYLWNFGDGSATSTEKNPVHTFEEAGTYTVVLTAKGADNATSTKSVDVTVTNPNTELKKLTGDVSKTWKLLRVPSNGYYPLQVGPADRSQIWWASGLNEEISARPCAFNDEFIFTLDGMKYTYDTKGDIWQDGSIWDNYQCVETSADGAFVGKGGSDLSAWNNGSFTFGYDVPNQKLTVTGNGAFVGLVKAGTDAEVAVPQAAVTYKVIKLVDGPTDTLVLETTISTTGYWRFVLVHYDTPSQEPEIPSAAVKAGFTFTTDGYVATFTNTSTAATSYTWDFGDGQTSTEANPVHTFAGDGAYDVILKADGPTGSDTETHTVTFSSIPFTEALLNGGGSKTWKLKPGVGTFEVGPGIGNGAYYGGSIDLSTDRPCLFDDEFTFKSNGEFVYDSKAELYVEDYWKAGVTGCQAPSAVTGNAAIWKSGTHAYSFTSGTGGNASTITVSGLGAFLVLPKAHNGGEYTEAPTTDAPVTYQVVSYGTNGTTDTLVIAIDVSGTGATYWTFTLTSPH